MPDLWGADPSRFHNGPKFMPKLRFLNGLLLSTPPPNFAVRASRSRCMAPMETASPGGKKSRPGNPRSPGNQHSAAKRESRSPPRWCWSELLVAVPSPLNPPMRPDVPPQFDGRVATEIACRTLQRWLARAHVRLAAAAGAGSSTDGLNSTGDVSELAAAVFWQSWATGNGEHEVARKCSGIKCSALGAEVPLTPQRRRRS